MALLPTPVTSIAASVLASPAVPLASRPTSAATSSNTCETKINHRDNWAEDIAARTAAIAAAWNPMSIRPSDSTEEVWVTPNLNPSCIIQKGLKIEHWCKVTETYTTGSQSVHFVYDDNLTELQQLADLGQCALLKMNLHFDSEKGLGLANAVLDTFMCATLVLLDAWNHVFNPPAFNSIDNMRNRSNFFDTYRNKFGYQIWIKVIAALKNNPEHQFLAGQLEETLMNRNSSTPTVMPNFTNLQTSHVAQLFVQSGLKTPVFDFEIDIGMSIEVILFRRLEQDLLRNLTLEKENQPLPIDVLENVLKVVMTNAYVLQIKTDALYLKTCAINFLKHLSSLKKSPELPIFCFIPSKYKEPFKRALDELTAKKS